MSAFFVEEAGTLAEASLDEEALSGAVSLEELRTRAISTEIVSSGTASTAEAFSVEELSVDDMVMMKSSLIEMEMGDC